MDGFEVFFPTVRNEKEWKPSSYVGAVIKYVLTSTASDIEPLWNSPAGFALCCPLASHSLAGSVGNVTDSAVLIICGWFFFLYFLVAEIGDFDEASDREHLAKNKYIPQQDALEDKIVEFHHNHM